jgi:hypothetical protein
MFSREIETGNDLDDATNTNDLLWAGGKRRRRQQQALRATLKRWRRDVSEQVRKSADADISEKEPDS